MAPMTRSTRGPSALLSPEIDGPLKSPQELNEGGWQMVTTQARSEREVSEEPASSFDGSELFDRAFDDDGYGSEKPAYDAPEDHEDILHPLREAANRVGREVERFAEVLDGYNPMRATEQLEKHEMTLELIEMYHGIAVDTLERLREQHSSARRRKDGARWRKKMRGFITEAVEDEMDLEEADEDESPNSQPQTTLEDLERWEQEAQTWDLLRRLVLLRFPTPGSGLNRPISHHKLLHNYSSERDVWKSFLESDDLALERKTVLQWLWDTADESGEEIDVLVQELQQNAERGDIIAHGWLHTKAAIKNQKRIHAWSQSLDPSSPDVQRVNLTSSKTGPLVTQLDPDSTTRQGRKLEAQDEYFERAIWLGCYEMLRRGRSSAEIKEWCMERTEIWRAVSMSGFPDETRHDDDEGGDPAASALWRRMCYALARKGGGDEYERAVYGLLSGDIQSVEPICRSWDDFLFVHYNALLKTQFDNYVQARNPQLAVGGPASKFGTFDAVQFHGEPETAAAKLIEGLKVDVRTRLEASHPMKMLQGVLIGNQFEHFAYQQGLALSKFANEHGPSILIPANNEQPENQNINRYIALDDHDSLRVLAHMLLIFISLDVDFGGVVRQGVVENIIVAYISFLRLAGKEELIPLYCSQLSGTRRYATLCRNLIDVIDPEQRATQIKLMRELGLDVQQFVKLQSRYLVADYPDEEEGYPAKGNFNIVENIPIYPGYDEPRVKPDFMGTEDEGVERVDLLLIRSLEWYLLVEGLWSETFLVGTMLYERFFKYMHLSAARMLAGRIPSAEIARSKTPAILGESLDLKGLEADDEDLTEVLDGSADQKRLLRQHLLSEATSYRELEKFSELLDNMETTSTLAMMIPEAGSWQQQWRQQLGSSVQLTKDSMTAVLNGWMLTSQTDTTFKDIRETYLPEAVLGYIAIMNFAGCHLTRHFHMEVMELSTIIAAEDSDLLALFMKTGRMQEMVEAFASVSKKLLIETSRGKKSNGSKSKRLRAKGWTQELWTIKQ